MSFPVQAQVLAIEALNAARRWVTARILLRRILDSKTAAPAQVEKAKATYNKAGEDLEKYIIRLERFIKANGQSISNKRKSTDPPFPWAELLKVVSTGAKALESALTPAAAATSTVMPTNVIDAEGE